MNIDFFNWILGCVHSTSFAVLINGVPSKNFGASMGLRKECSISPFIFLLIVEGLSKLMSHARCQGEINGLKTSLAKILSHLLFIDDILMFGVDVKISESQAHFGPFLPSHWNGNKLDEFLCSLFLMFIVSSPRRIYLPS